MIVKPSSRSSLPKTHRSGARTGPQFHSGRCHAGSTTGHTGRTTATTTAGTDLTFWRFGVGVVVNWYLLTLQLFEENGKNLDWIQISRKCQADGTPSSDPFWLFRISQPVATKTIGQTKRNTMHWLLKYLTLQVTAHSYHKSCGINTPVSNPYLSNTIGKLQEGFPLPCLNDPPKQKGVEKLQHQQQSKHASFMASHRSGATGPLSLPHPALHWPWPGAAAAHAADRDAAKAGTTRGAARTRSGCLQGRQVPGIISGISCLICEHLSSKQENKGHLGRYLFVPGWCA